MTDENMSVRIARNPVAAAMGRRMVAHSAWNASGGGSTETDEANNAESALVAALDADDARRRDFAIMYRILDQMFGSEQWMERFRIRPVPWNDDTVLVARDIQRAEDIDRWKSEFSAVIDRASQRGDDVNGDESP